MASVVVTRNLKGITLLRRRIVKIHDDVVKDIDGDAWVHAPVDTGALRASIHIRKLRPLHSQVVVGTDHWRFVEYPTSAHVIRPRSGKKGLFWPGAPHPVQMVHHPGTSAQPFMRPALYQRRSLVGRPYYR